MPAATDRFEFTPPPQPALVRAFVLALLAHLLLLAALTWGVKWQRESQDAVVDAELWSSVPQQAAPKEVAPPPPPPQPEPKVQPKPEPPQPTEAEIALEKQKKAAETKRREEELARKKEAEHRKEEAEKKRREEAKLAQEKQRKEDADRKKREERDAQQREKLRQETLAKLQGMAGATGAPSSTGNAQRSSGPSANWGARVNARVKPNIAFRDEVAGNPETVVAVRLAPDGTIVSRRIVKPSGHPAWDDAVLRALDKTEVLPRDIDGRVPPGGDLVFRPKD
ncbi:cell envelope integrity protein TolA [Ramlibacter sp. GTP1]|uniref:Cell envelope integrity protein TolA n=1 Tax=Ramlibacter albus TaxID=2079448 RepID=A0A923S8L9_9BURK|nr:cell envelope integrity protein TolA [Ramlibacter albus]MBC5768232.1 cell envelope integrity protein TolA [Ramlibacter albus]